MVRVNVMILQGEVIKINIQYQINELMSISIKLDSILDILDYVSNYVLMPIVALLTCILVGWISKPKSVIDEVKCNGEKFGREGLYKVMVKFIAPVCLILIFISAFGVFNNL